MGGKRGECVLCGRMDVKLTKEHIYGDWMRELLPGQARGRVMTRVHFDPKADHPATGSQRIERRTENDFHHQTRIRVLCDPCNTKWGSPVETAAQRVLTPMILGGSNHLEADAIEAVTTWVTKVAILREFLDPPEWQIFSREQRIEFRRTSQPPSGIWIWAARLANPDSDWGHRAPRRIAIIALEEDIGLPDDPNASLGCFAFGSLLLFVLVASCEVGEINDPALLVPDLFQRIHPDASPFDWPPEEAFEGPDVDGVLSGMAAFFRYD